MVTAKLRALWQLIRADHVMLFTIKNSVTDAVAFGPTDLEDMVAGALMLKTAYLATLEAATAAATENGELRTLEAIKKVVDGLEDGGK